MDEKLVGKIRVTIDIEEMGVAYDGSQRANWTEIFQQRLESLDVAALVVFINSQPRKVVDPISIIAD